MIKFEFILNDDEADILHDYACNTREKELKSKDESEKNGTRDT